MNENDDAQLTPISKARTPEEIAEFWDSHSLDDYWDETHKVEFEVRAKRGRTETLDPEVYAERENETRARRGLPESMADASAYEYDIFLSHNHKDEEWTEELAARLEQEQWQGRNLRVFFSPWEIRPGQSIPKEIERGLLKSRKFGLVMSPEAMGSAWIELERLVTTHIDISERQERLIPLFLRDCEIPVLLRPILSIDFKNAFKFEEGYGRLLAVIKGEPLPRGSRSSSGSVISAPLCIPRPPVVGFVARRDKQNRDIVARLVEELAPQKNQFIALWGAGGVGKSALAAETAHALVTVFAQRVVWASAEGRSDFSLSTLLDETATYLGRSDLRKLALDAKKEEVRALIGAADTLIVLDNFETIAPDEQVACAGYLHQLATCPALVTTRQRISGAHNIPIEAMSLNEARKFVGRFIEQETHDQDAFAGLDQDHIIQIAEGNPLVLQWIIAQIDLAQDPKDVLNELSQGEGDAAERVFDRSFNLRQVGDRGRDTLLALSLFVPSASRPALAHVAGLGENNVKRLNKTVMQLSSLWLLNVTEGNQRVMVQGLTRDLARSRLFKDTRASQFKRRFATYFVLLAEARSKDSAADYEALFNERENILGAMEVAYEQKDWKRVIRFGYSAYKMLDTRGYWDEALRCTRQALEAARKAHDELAVAQLSYNLGVTFQNRGDLEQAKTVFDESLTISKKIGSDIGFASCLHALGVIAHRQGLPSEARELYSESLAIHRRVENLEGVAGGLHQMGRLARDYGDLKEARRLYSMSLDISKKLNQQEHVAMTLINLASITRVEGNLEETQRLLVESKAIAKELGDPQLLAMVLHNLGLVARRRKDSHEARCLASESRELASKLGDQYGVAITCYQSGILAQDEGNRTEAIRLYSKALSIFEKLGSPDAEYVRQSLKDIESERK